MLNLYPDLHAAPVSVGDASNPAVLAVDSAATAVTVRRFYLQNNAVDRYYDNIRLTPQQIPTGWSVKLLRQETPPSEAEWAAVENNNTLEFGAIGSADGADVGFHPFWVRLQVPAHTTPQSRLCGLRITYQEYTL